LLFNSSEFLFYFLPITLLITQLLSNAGKLTPRSFFLVVASYAFYVWWNPRDALIVTSSIAANYWLGQRITYAADHAVAKRFLLLAVIANLVLLGFFKYWAFLVQSFSQLTGAEYTTPSFKLPLGISFFTFLQIAFVVDAYRERGSTSGGTPTTSYGLLPYGLFVLFFPHLIAGPLVSHNRLIPQFTRILARKRRWLLFSSGLLLFVLGLAKKVIIADSLAPHANAMFAAAGEGKPIAMSVAWLGSLAYTFQLYFDFSGYSDMAIGAARMLGFKLPANFRSPYQSTSIIDFWRRWHMTLSAFLRQYLYIPLGGSRAGKFAQLRNLMITMLLGGLWHGAGWTFVLWGGLHGAYLVINHLWRQSPFAKLTQSGVGRLAAWALTFVAVTLAWVLFRSPNLDTALHVYRQMFDPLAPGAAFVSALKAHNLQAYFEALTGIGFTNLRDVAHFGGVQGLAWLMIAMSIAFLLPNSQRIVASALRMNRPPRAAPLSRFMGAALVSTVAVLLFLSLARLNNIS
jgi:alginate O-acetyltransferase complex protein AlgI